MMFYDFTLKFFYYIFILGAEMSGFQDLTLLQYLSFLFHRTKFSQKIKNENHKWSFKTFCLLHFYQNETI